MDFYTHKITGTKNGVLYSCPNQKETQHQNGFVNED